MAGVVTTRVYKHAYGERIALVFPQYDANAQRVLKDNIDWPAFQWDKEEKVWSIQRNSHAIHKSCEVLRDLGYDVKNIAANADNLSDFQKNEYNPKSDTWTKVKGVRLYLHWPFIRDSDLRDRVLNAVRSISGRKFHNDNKCWSIPVQQASTLYSMVEGMYDKLAEAILSNPEIAEEIEKSIGRVEISGASVLKEVDEKRISDTLNQVLPEGLDLYPFQKVAVAFAEASNGRCLIGDEMGIGKTISAIGYAAINPTDRPVVVVAPANVKYNWKKELNKWLPNEKVHVVNSKSNMNADDKKALALSKGATEEQVKFGTTAEKYLESIGEGLNSIPMSDFVLINYDIVKDYRSEIRKLAPRMVILDEVHYLKNSGSTNKPVQRTQATLDIATVCPKVLALSGTAIASRPKEFFNTLNLMRPDQFPNAWNFYQRYCDPWNTGWGWDLSGASNIKELNERTRDLCIRRLKSEVLPDLPPKTRTFLPIHLPADIRSPYDAAQDEWERRIEEHYLNGEPLPQGMMLNMLNDLRHICGRIKTGHAVEWISQYTQQTGKPIVVFTHHRDVMELIGQGILELANKKIDPVKLTVDYISGSVSSQKRQDIVENFQAGKINVLICNTIAAKEGITLTKADTVLFIEREWVPTDEEQAEDRVYRIGQESDNVHAVYLSCAGTIDEHFDRVVEEKRRVVKAVLDGGDVEQRKGLVAQLVQKLKKERGWKYEPVINE